MTLPLAIAGTFLAAPAFGQWARLQRCAGALPCAIPFGVRYAPDPLIASQYGFVSPNAASGRISFEPGGPVIHIDQPHVALELGDFAAQAARRFLLAHPPPPTVRTPPATKKAPPPSD